MTLDAAIEIISRNLSSLYIARRPAETEMPEMATLVAEGVTANGYRVSGLLGGYEGEEPVLLQECLIALAEEWIEYEQEGYQKYYTEAEADGQ